jgi:hypothetical protein
MNPYLEQDDVWQDFHESMILAIREDLVRQVVPNYIVKVEEHVYIHERSADERRFLGRPDVSLGPRAQRDRTGSSVVTTTAPAYGRIPEPIDFERLSFLEVRDRRKRELITVVEMLSPSNKNPGPDREQYLSKRRRLLAASVHLVELDLLRGGPRLPIDDLPECEYYVLVSRMEERPHVGLWPIGLRDPLPNVPVPLRGPDPDAHVDLKTVLDRVYDAAGYSTYLYEGAPEPPLNAADAEWASRFVPGEAA